MLSHKRNIIYFNRIKFREIKFHKIKKSQNVLYKLSQMNNEER